MKHLLHYGIGTFIALMVMSIGIVAAPATFANGSTPIKASDQTCDKNPDGSIKVNIVEGLDCSKGDDTQATLFEEDTQGRSLFKTITNVLLFLIGAISVIMLIIGGFKYVVSNGDSAAVTSAKNTILYAVIGIVIALLAYAIVNFVVGSFTN